LKGPTLKKKGGISPLFHNVISTGLAVGAGATGTTKQPSPHRDLLLQMAKHCAANNNNQILTSHNKILFTTVLRCKLTALALLAV
jgi:hypothetical protein